LEVPPRLGEGPKEKYSVVGKNWGHDEAEMEFGRKRAKMKRRGLRMVLEKVRRRRLYCLSLVRLMVLFFYFNCYFLFVI